MPKQFFENVIHRSDQSAGRRWLFGIAATIILMPLLGSVGSVIVTTMAICAIPYFCFRKIYFSREEKLIFWIVSLYLALNFAGMIIFENLAMGWFYASSNLGFLTIFFLLPVLRLVPLPNLEENLSKIFIASALVTSLAAGLEYTLTDTFRAELKSGNSLLLSYMAGAIGLMCLAYSFNAKGAMKNLGITGLLASISTLLFAGGKGPIIAMALCLVLALVQRFWKKMNLKVVTNLLLIALAISIIGFFSRDLPAVKNMSYRFWKTIDTIDQNKYENSAASTAVRIIYTKAALALVEKHPFTGYGRQNIMKEAAKHAPEQAKRWFSRTHLHNAFLTETASYGIAGLIVFILLLMTPVIGVRQGNKTQKQAALIFAVYSSLCFFFNIGFYQDVTVFFFVIMTVTLHSWASQTKQQS